VAPEREERRLAAILAADMVGYSRLMEADERGTIARQKAHREELIDVRITIPFTGLEEPRGQCID